MTTKYTKGPWEIAEDCNENLFGDAISIDILDDRDFPIATVDATPIIHDWPRKFPNMEHWADGANDGRTQIERPYEQVIANARLIAAAPDLLEAVKVCLKAEQERRKKLLPGAPATTYCDNRIAMLEAAIAKATGADHDH